MLSAGSAGTPVAMVTFYLGLFQKKNPQGGGRQRFFVRRVGVSWSYVCPEGGGEMNGRCPGVGVLTLP